MEGGRRDWDEGRYFWGWLVGLDYLKYKKFMSLLYYWGKPITKSLFQHQDGHQVLSFTKSITQVSSGEKHCVVVLGDSVIGFGDASEGQLGEV